jgi:hypothetical protein
MAARELAAHPGIEPIVATRLSTQAGDLARVLEVTRRSV